MKQHSIRSLQCLARAIGLVSLLGCGNVDPEMPQGAMGGSSGAIGSVGGGALLTNGFLLPWQTGNTWTYRVTQAGVITMKTTTVGAAAEVGGTGPNATLAAFQVVTTKGTDMMDRTESWQGPDPETPDRIVRYRERSYGATTGALKIEEHWGPAKLHVDGSTERTDVGATWLELYSETKLEVGLAPVTRDVSERWTVLSSDQSLTVPAGTFEHAIHLRKEVGAAVKEYWYVREVGKVKETGTQTEELTEYALVAQKP